MCVDKPAWEFEATKAVLKERMPKMATEIDKVKDCNDVAAAGYCDAVGEAKSMCCACSVSPLLDCSCERAHCAHIIITKNLTKTGGGCLTQKSCKALVRVNFPMPGLLCVRKVCACCARSQLTTAITLMSRVTQWG